MLYIFLYYKVFSVVKERTVGMKSCSLAILGESEPVVSLSFQVGAGKFALSLNFCQSFECCGLAVDMLSFQ